MRNLKRLLGVLGCALLMLQSSSAVWALPPDQQQLFNENINYFDIATCNSGTDIASGSPIGGNIQDLAKQVLSNSNITFDYGPNGPTGTQFKRLANGQKAETDNGRQVDVEPIILVVVLHIAQSHKVQLSALTDGSSHTAPTNPHGSGKAVDIDFLDGQGTNGSDAIANQIVDSAAQVLPNGARFGMGSTPLGTKQIDGKTFTVFPDNPNHVHVDVMGVSQSADDQTVQSGGGGDTSNTNAPNQAQCCSGSGSSTDGAVLTGGSRPIQAFNFFVTYGGFTPNQAAGIVGNMMLESGVDPQKVQGGGESSTPTGSGWGIVQFTPPSNAYNIQRAANVSGQIGDLLTQLKMVLAQLQGKAGSYNDAQVGKDIKSTTTVQDAVLAFQGNAQVGGKYFGYERPADESASVGQRTTYANQVLKGGGGGSSGCASADNSSIGAYKNPLRDVKQLRPERIDQGVDYAGEGPVYALGNGTIKNLTNSGWNFGGYDGFVSEQLSDGPAAGKYVYVAEACVPANGLHIGQQVTPDTVICNMINPGSTGIETGWASPPGDGKPLAQDYGGSGSCTTTVGINYNDLLKAVGAPSGINECSPTLGQPLPASWPTWK